jgi:ABC-type amino acid transport substrate-binding protein
VNKALTTMVEDGTIARLQRKWLTTGIDKPPVLR